MRTTGLSPKAVAATVMAILGYLTTQELVEFPAWADLILMAVLVGGGAFLASPGDVEPRAPRSGRLRSEGGQVWAQVIVGVLAAAVLLLLLRDLL